MSQTDFEEKQIGEHVYKVYMLPAMKSQRLFISTLKMLGPSLGPILDKFSGKKIKDIMNTNLSTDFLSKAVSLLFENLDEDKIDNLIRVFSEKTLVDDKKLKDSFDLHFKGRLDQLYQWFLFAVMVQWGNSLGALWKSTESQGADLESP